MRETTLLLLLSAALLVVGGLYLYLESGEATSELKAMQSVDIDRFSVYMHRLGCVADCPTYAVLAKGSGELEFEGVANVGVVGSQSASVTDAQMQLLFLAVYRSGLLQLTMDRIQGMAGCRAPEPGHDRITYGVTLDGNTQVITYYLGCEEKLPGLEALARRIDEILETRRWITVAVDSSAG